MLDYTYVEKFNINYLRVRDPFVLQELFSLLVAPRNKDDPLARKGPVILDFRQVNFARIEMHDIRRHLIKKGDLDAELTDFTCAYVMANPEAASKMRVANIFSDLTGVTAEEKTFVTEDITEAAGWIAKKLKENKFSVYQELEAMALVADRPPPYQSF